MSLPSVKPGFGRLELDADMPGGGRTVLGSPPAERGLPEPEPEGEGEEARERPLIPEASDPGWCWELGLGRPWEPRGGRPLAVDVDAEPPSGGREPREAIWMLGSGQM